ncbi:hypothetical protein HPB51_012111 [Rhipicephalus microplus]|uniref:Uncharacterized protein n=1 Tax=Rhipicephalus microplus TaxID=6941 RepID=A0A9J6EN35_RHIMP|nr:hypothetical protein HPB51_012111 [Rhipicephalus microplus]
MPVNSEITAMDGGGSVERAQAAEKVTEASARRWFEVAMACRTVQSSLKATGEKLRLSSGDGTDVAPYTKTGKRGEADWDVHLPSVTFAINTALQTSTREAPYKFVFGKLPQLKVVLSLETVIINPRANDRKAACQKIQTKAIKKATQAHENQKPHYYRCHRPTPAYTSVTRSGCKGAPAGPARSNSLSSKGYS